LELDQQFRGLALVAENRDHQRNSDSHDGLPYRHCEQSDAI
jgi:hypothetical protein